MSRIESLRPEDRRAFHINEAAKAYGLSRSTIYKLMEAGTLRTIKIGGRRLIPRDSLEGLLNGAAANEQCP